jgi:hypothetical protein
MALTKSVSMYGTTFPNAYYKIMGEMYREGEKVDGVKTYICDVHVTLFSDSSKEYVLERTVRLENREGFLEADKTTGANYTWLKTLPQFDGAVDA